MRRKPPSKIVTKSKLEAPTNVISEEKPKARPKKPPKSKVGFLDTLRVGVSGIKTRKLRSALSALGITIGIAALIGVLGLSASGSADLMRSLDALGTNLLTIRAGEGFGQNQSELPVTAQKMIRRINPVYEVSTVSKVPGSVYRNDLIDDGRTKGIAIFAVDLNLIRAQRGTIKEGSYLSEITAKYPTVVLGSVAAERLGITLVSTEQKIWLGGKWFTVVGILDPLPLAADLDRGALIGYDIASELLDHDGNIDVIYVRALPEYIEDVRSVMATTVNPENPEEVQVSRASDVLQARVAADNTFTNLFVGLGAVSLLVGGIGIANVMVIAVIERRNEIGLRRALGATKFHIATQFITESLSLSLIGGAAGVLSGILITSIYATTRDWAIVVPLYSVIGGLLASLIIGGLAGFYPAIRAANMPPTEALRTR
jgi:putative ABC transport system permease protein